MNSRKRKIDELEQLNSTNYDMEDLNMRWLDAVNGIDKKIIVLDDDPTGIQTVHSIPVYTSWREEDLEDIFNDTSKLVYILTNSRSFTEEKTEKVHKDITRDILKISKRMGKDFLIISRGDSTLRGHYPLETKIIYDELKSEMDIDGEIIVPFFLEGGRYTMDDVHYVKEGEYLVPAGQTEFASDPTFGFQSSDLKNWINEKSMRTILQKDIESISLDSLKGEEYQKILNKLMGLKDFSKLIVNSTEYTDLKVFCIALAQAIRQGKKFIFRTAASFVQVIAGIEQQPLLNQNDLVGDEETPGIIMVGSFVDKTSRQLNELKKLDNIDFLEWDVRNAISDEAAKEESERVIEEIEKSFNSGRDVCIYTSRNYKWADDKVENREENLQFSLRVSKGLVNVIKGLKQTPSYVLAKGGITSSDIGVVGLEVKKAEVLGQVKPGIPVWKTGLESRFPGISYIIFPGNVGEDSTLREVIEILKG